MDIESYQNYILTIYEQGSLSRAAKELNISQPAVSLALSQLEKRIGFRIFDRKKTPILPTAEGRVYLDYLMEKKRLERDCFRRIADMEKDSVKALRVGGPAVYVESMLLRAVYKLRERDEKIRFSVKTAHLPELIRETLEGKLDGFVSTSGSVPKGLKAEFLKKEELFLCMPESWGLLGELIREPGNLAPLNGREMIFLEESQPLQKDILRILETCGLQVENRLTVNQVSTSLRMVEMGLGMAVISGEGLLLRNDAAKISIFPLPPELSERELFFCYDTGHYLPEAARELINIMRDADFLRERFAG